MAKKKEYMTKEQLYDAHKLIKKIDAPDGVKKRVFSELMGGYEYIWEVVGITKNALKRLKTLNYKLENGHGIQRAHIIDRTKTYEHLLNNELGFEAWWRYFEENNKTILSLKEENHIINQIPDDDKIKIKKTSLNLFKSSGFAWRHTKEEETHLEELYKLHIEKING